jgi:hypothetical protein
MSATIDSTGLSIQSFDDVLEEIIVAQATGLGLTPAQTQRMREGVTSTLGQIVRIEAEREVACQEALLAVYNALSLEAEGPQLDRVVRLLGMTRIPAALSRVVGTATATPGTTIPVGARLRYDVLETTWEVTVGGLVPGGGTLSITIEREAAGADEVPLDPAVGFDDWTILDTVVGWSDVGSFESTAQPIVGRDIETDAALRVRATTEAYKRGAGPIKAIESAILEVEGVTYARVYENRTLVTDSDGIPGKAINPIVVGGADADVAAAIFASRSAGAEVYGTDVTQNVTDTWGFVHVMRFDRVDDVNVWVRCTITTSTAEDETPIGVDDTVEDLILEQAAVSFSIGDDVRPYVLSGAIFAAGLPGIDNVLIELSPDGVTWQTTKLSIGIRARAAFAAARVTIVEI